MLFSWAAIYQWWRGVAALPTITPEPRNLPAVSSSSWRYHPDELIPIILIYPPQLQVPVLKPPPLLLPEPTTVIIPPVAPPEPISLVYESMFLPDQAEPLPIKFVPVRQPVYYRKEPYYDANLYSRGRLVVDTMIPERSNGGRDDPDISVMIWDDTVTVWGANLTVTMECVHRTDPHVCRTRQSSVRPMGLETDQSFLRWSLLTRTGQWAETSDPAEMHRRLFCDVLVRLPDRGLSVEINLLGREVDIKGAEKMLVHINPDHVAAYEDVPDPPTNIVCQDAYIEGYSLELP